MDGLSHFRRLLSYDHWAAIETHSSIRRAGDPPPKSLRWLGHILGAEWLWLGRLRGQEKAVEVWPELSLDECQGQIGDLAPAWRTYLDRLGPDDLSQSVSYTNTKGEPWTNRVEDILMHVVTHSAYHRGQIASDLRASGPEPAYTDFIHSVRRGFID